MTNDSCDAWIELAKRTTTDYRYNLFFFSQITQRSQTNAAKLHYFADKDRLCEVKAALLFWVSSAIICEICGRLLGFFCASIKEETQETVAARMQQTVTVSHFVASQATTKI